jgi:transcriptional regulator with GAF, ATPase, and Fis domain
MTKEPSKPVERTRDIASTDETTACSPARNMRGSFSTQGALIGPGDLPARMRTGGRSPEAGASKASAPGALEPEQAREKVQQFEARMLQEALAATGWNQAKAARKLGMPVRTLSYRLKVLGVKKPQ